MWDALIAFFRAHYDFFKDFTTPMLTVIGFTITLGLGVAGFRSFKKWRREQIEERRIEVAFEALNIAYKAKHVFEHIRAPLIYDYEWDDMPAVLGDTNDRRRHRGSL